MKTWIEHIRQHAMIHYTEDGWDILIECWDDAYINEHLTMKYRKEVEREMGIELPPVGEPLPPEAEARLASLVSEAAQRVASTNAAKAEQARIQQQAQDPLILAKQKELEIRETQVKGKCKGGKKLPLNRKKAN